ncbi:MAG TPA: hypothetical protein K8W21_08760, partial [Enorma massiliensis]|uniref:hypothetical protein n=1 Tax=Enorma massiliensis TaxID=1472761 RepID=UPI001DA02A8D
LQRVQGARIVVIRKPRPFRQGGIKSWVKAESKSGFIRGWLQKRFLWFHLTTLHKIYYLDLIDEQDKLMNVCEP